jgi:hypothetical protein
MSVHIGHSCQCVLLHIRLCLKVRWQSSAVQLAKFLWRLKIPLDVLLYCLSKIISYGRINVECFVLVTCLHKRKLCYLNVVMEKVWWIRHYPVEFIQDLYEWPWWYMIRFGDFPLLYFKKNNINVYLTVTMYYCSSIAPQMPILQVPPE